MKIITVFLGIILVSLADSSDNSIDLDREQVCASLNNVYKTFANIWELYNEFKTTGKQWIPVDKSLCPADDNKCTEASPVCAVSNDKVYKTVPNGCVLNSERETANIVWNIVSNGTCSEDIGDDLKDFSATIQLPISTFFEESQEQVPSKYLADSPIASYYDEGSAKVFPVIKQYNTSEPQSASIYSSSCDSSSSKTISDCYSPDAIPQNAPTYPEPELQPAPSSYYPSSKDYNFDRGLQLSLADGSHSLSPTSSYYIPSEISQPIPPYPVTSLQPAPASLYDSHASSLSSSHHSSSQNLQSAPMYPVYSLQPSHGSHSSLSTSKQYNSIQSPHSAPAYQPPLQHGPVLVPQPAPSYPAPSPQPAPSTSYGSYTSSATSSYNISASSPPTAPLKFYGSSFSSTGSTYHNLSQDLQSAPIYPVYSVQPSHGSHSSLSSCNNYNAIQGPHPASSYPISSLPSALPPHYGSQSLPPASSFYSPAQDPQNNARYEEPGISPSCSSHSSPLYSSPDILQPEPAFPAPSPQQAPQPSYGSHSLPPGSCFHNPAEDPQSKQNSSCNITSQDMPEPVAPPSCIPSSDTTGFNYYSSKEDSQPTLSHQSSSPDFGAIPAPTSSPSCDSFSPAPTTNNHSPVHETQPSPTPLAISYYDESSSRDMSEPVPSPSSSLSLLEPNSDYYSSKQDSQHIPIHQSPSCYDKNPLPAPYSPLPSSNSHNAVQEPHPSPALSPIYYYDESSSQDISESPPSPSCDSSSLEPDSDYYSSRQEYQNIPIHPSPSSVSSDYDKSPAPALSSPSDSPSLLPSSSCRNSVKDSQPPPAPLPIPYYNKSPAQEIAEPAPSPLCDSSANDLQFTQISDSPSSSYGSDSKLTYPATAHISSYNNEDMIVPDPSLCSPPPPRSNYYDPGEETQTHSLIKDSSNQNYTQFDTAADLAPQYEYSSPSPSSEYDAVHETKPAPAFSKPSAPSYGTSPTSPTDDALCGNAYSDSSKNSKHPFSDDNRPSQPNGHYNSDKQCTPEKEPCRNAQTYTSPLLQSQKSGEVAVTTLERLEKTYYSNSNTDSQAIEDSKQKVAQTVYNGNVYHGPYYYEPQYKYIHFSNFPSYPLQNSPSGPQSSAEPSPATESNLNFLRMMMSVF